MGRRGWAAVILALTAAWTLGGVYVEEFPGLSAVAQYGLPTPPMQRKPWTPPEGALGNVFASAVAVLFEQGLPDPRGCEYREVAVPRLFLRGEMELVKTHGWVLPPSPGLQQFAICWDGLIYPVTAVGKPADLKADVAAALRHEDALRAEQVAQYPDRPFRLNWESDKTYRAPNTDEVLPLRACLLLRLGEADLAGQVWQVVLRDYGPGIGRAAHGDDPYLVLAADWAWAKYDRAVAYHCRGINPLALAELKGLDGLGQRLLDQATGRGFDREMAQYVLAFLDEVPKMLADQQRRRGVDDLIRDLEDVRLLRHGEPGGFEYSQSATIVQLVLLGEPAVEPLLHAMENDDRLSRTVDTGRSFSRVGRVVPVRVFEWEAATAIVGDPPVRDLASLRAWWQANKDRPPAERYYAALADDAAASQMWLWGAELIVRPADWPLVPLNLPGPWLTYPTPRELPKWTGEPLRDGRQPAVSDLMARRALAISQADQSRSWRMLQLLDATRMGVYLARWDPQAAPETMRALQRSWQDLLGGRAVDQMSARQVACALAELTIARVHTGDDQALRDYAEWVQAGYTRDTRPLLLAPKDPAVVSATKWAAEHMELSDRLDWTFKDEYAPGGPMLAVEPFRAYVLRNLRDTDPLGSAWVNKDGWVERDGRLWAGARPTNPPAPGTKASVRVCDSVAWSLSSLPGFPKFDPFEPLAERDQAAAECARLLTEKGERFSRAIDTELYWARWLRQSVSFYPSSLSAVFKPERALSGD